jgi:hypothetical protein
MPRTVPRRRRGDTRAPGRATGVITAAPTLAEAKTTLRDALARYLASFDTIPEPTGKGIETEELALHIAS